MRLNEWVYSKLQSDVECICMPSDSFSSNVATYSATPWPIESARSPVCVQSLEINHRWCAVGCTQISERIKPGCLESQFLRLFYNFVVVPNVFFLPQISETRCVDRQLSASGNFPLTTSLTGLIFGDPVITVGMPILHSSESSCPLGVSQTCP